MTQNKNQSILSLDVKNIYSHAMSKFLPINGFKWIDPKEFDLKKYASNSCKGSRLDVDFENPKELRESNNDYHLAPDKLKIKREMLSEYQLKIDDLYSIPYGNIKKLVPIF